ncbi:MAG TPA: MSMEG_0568 family radical SAM protein, partial [Actinomycetota bacterium]|nr:MSMEG_0568 family radical SAM protein [Actinomycetota bacterium]
VELQRYGVQVEENGARSGGAGPSDAGMMWIEGVPVTFPFAADFVGDSPFSLREEEDGWQLYRDGQRLAAATVPPRPKCYSLSTADGIPYWKIALLHLDSLASTVIQTCIYWGNENQCHFCGIELSLDAGRTIPVKRPWQLAEVAKAAKELDGAVDITLTTGTTNSRDRGALYLAKCAKAMKESSGLPVQGQFEPPDDLEVLEQVKEMGVDSVGIHIESFDPEVFPKVAPGKAKRGIEAYFKTWEKAVEVFGEGQVSTYVILGMGEDPKATVDGCKRAIDMGVYPFVVPIRPIPGSILQDLLPPPPSYVESMYRQVVPHLIANGFTSANVKAGCARCNACSGMSAFEHEANGSSRRSLPILQVG